MFYGSGYNLSWHIFHGYMKRMCILLVLGGVFYKCWLDPVGWWWCWVLYFAGFVSHGSINCWDKGAQISNCNQGFVYFSFQFYYFLIHIFCFKNSSFLWPTYIWDCFVPLVDWPFYHYVIIIYQMYLSVSGNFLCSEAYMILILTLMLSVC